MTIMKGKEKMTEQPDIKQGRSLKAAGQQMLSSNLNQRPVQNQPSRPSPAPFTSSLVPQFNAAKEDSVPLPENSLPSAPRTSEVPKLPGLTLLPIKETSFNTSGIEDTACRNFRRVDSQTVIPGSVFEGMMRLGKEAVKRGAHRFETRQGGRGVLKASTVEPKLRCRTCPPSHGKRPMANSKQQWEDEQTQHLIGRLNNVERVPRPGQLMSARNSSVDRISSI